MKQITLLSACLTLTSWCGLAATASAQDSNIQTMPLCPGGEVIELDGQAVCAKTDTLNLLIEDFEAAELEFDIFRRCLLYTSPSPRDATLSRMPSSA